MKYIASLLTLACFQTAFAGNREFYCVDSLSGNFRAAGKIPLASLPSTETEALQSGEVTVVYADNTASFGTLIISELTEESMTYSNFGGHGVGIVVQSHLSFRDQLEGLIFEPDGAQTTLICEIESVRSKP